MRDIEKWIPSYVTEKDEKNGERMQELRHAFHKVALMFMENGEEISDDMPRLLLELVKSATMDEIAMLAKIDSNAIVAQEGGEAVVVAGGEDFALAPKIEVAAASASDLADVFSQLTLLRAKADEYIQEHPVDKNEGQQRREALLKAFGMVAQAHSASEVPDGILRAVAGVDREDLNDLARLGNVEMQTMADTAAVPNNKAGELDQLPTEKVVGLDFDKEGWMRSYAYWAAVQGKALNFLGEQLPPSQLN